MKATITITEQKNGAFRALLEFDPPLTEESANNPLAQAAMAAMEALTALDSKNKKSCHNKKTEHVCACGNC